MIRINLSSLAPPKTKRGRRTATPAVSVPGEGSGSAFMVLVLVVVLVLAIGGSYLWLDRQHAQLVKEMDAATAENQRLAEVKAKYEASKKKADMFERRVKVIDELKEAQKGPVKLLDLVADTVNK